MLPPPTIRSPSPPVNRSSVFTYRFLSRSSHHASFVVFGVSLLAPYTSCAPSHSVFHFRFFLLLFVSRPPTFITYSPDQVVSLPHSFTLPSITRSPSHPASLLYQLTHHAPPTLTCGVFIRSLLPRPPIAPPFLYGNIKIALTVFLHPSYTLILLASTSLQMSDMKIVGY